MCAAVCTHARTARRPARRPAVRQLCALTGPNNAQQFLILSFSLVLPWLAGKMHIFVRLRHPAGRSHFRSPNIRTNSSCHNKALNRRRLPSFGWAAPGLLARGSLVAAEKFHAVHSDLALAGGTARAVALRRSALGRGRSLAVTGSVGGQTLYRVAANKGMSVPGSKRAIQAELFCL